MSQYLLDANIYINFYERYYQIDFFPSFWQQFNHVINHYVVVADIVVAETYQSIWFTKWLDNNFQGAYCNHKHYAEPWAEVINHIYNHPCYSPKAFVGEKSWAREQIADGWLVAIAKRDDLTIVTNELRNANLNKYQPSKSPKLPDIANDLGVACINMNDFFAKVGLVV